MEDFRPSELPAVDTDVQLRLLQGPVSSAGLHLTQSADVDLWPLTSARPACDGGVAESRPCGAESCFLVFQCSFCSIKNPKMVRSCDGSGRKIRFKCKKKKTAFLVSLLRLPRRLPAVWELQLMCRRYFFVPTPPRRRLRLVCAVEELLKNTKSSISVFPTVWSQTVSWNYNVLQKKKKDCNIRNKFAGCFFVCLLIQSRPRLHLNVFLKVKYSPLRPCWRASFYSECCHVNKMLFFFFLLAGYSYKNKRQRCKFGLFFGAESEVCSSLFAVSDTFRVCARLLQQFIKLIRFLFTVFFIKYIQTHY